MLSRSARVARTTPPCGPAPGRLVEHAVHVSLGLEPRDGDVELFGDAAVHGAVGRLEDQKEGEHGTKTTMRNVECGMRNGRASVETVALRIVTSHFYSAFHIPHSAFYSYLSATIGSRLAARRAGQIPKNSPTAALNTKASRMARGEIRVFQCASR